jgi:hypothetical protein
VYALAGAHMKQMDRWREGDWAKWERRVQAADLFDKPAVEAAPAAPAVAAEPAAPAETMAPRRTRTRGRINAGGGAWPR